MEIGEITAEYRRWDAMLDKRASAEVNAMKEASIDDAFAYDLVFGTGGLRGKLGQGPNRLNSFTVGRATQGLANWLKHRGELSPVAICRDSRHGSDEFACRAAETLAANGIKTLIYPRVEPTPALSFAVRSLGCSAGIVITASHNPKEYNGYKVYGSDGCQITVSVANEIQSEINRLDSFDDVKRIDFKEGVSSGLICQISDDILCQYCSAILEQSTNIDCSDLCVAYTPLNGTGLEVVSRVLRSSGISNLHVVPEQSEPNGDFPTCPKPNPEEPAALKLGIDLGKSLGADILLATDPDADRLGVAIPHAGEWKLLTGNELGLLLLDFLASRAEDEGADMSRKVAVTTVVSTPMADDLARAYGFELRRTLTGFKFCGEQIGILEQQGRETDFLFGFEESYGYLAGTYVRDKDSVVSCMLACEMAAFWKERGLDLWEAMQNLYIRYGHWGNMQVSVTCKGEDSIGRMTSIMSNLRDSTPDKVGGTAIEAAIDYIDGAPMPVVNQLVSEEMQILPPSNVLEWRLEGGSRVLIRPSGTEPKIKAYVFARGETQTRAEDLLDRVTKDIKCLLS